MVNFTVFRNRKLKSQNENTTKKTVKFRKILKMCYSQGYDSLKKAFS